MSLYCSRCYLGQCARHRTRIQQRARHREWAELHRQGLTPTAIARLYQVDHSTVCGALNKKRTGLT